MTQDLRRDGIKETGREGLPTEAVLRCALLKQYRQLSYQELAFLPGFCPAAKGVEPEEVGLAQDDQRDPGANL